MFCMEKFKDEIREWLRENEKSREWLSQKCFVSKRTLDRWLTKDETIPSAKMALLKSLMAPPSAIQGTVQLGLADITIKIPLDKYNEFLTCAHEKKISIQEWILQVLSYAGMQKEEMQRYIASMPTNEIGMKKINSTKSYNATKSPASTETNPNDSVEAARYTATGLPGLPSTGNAS